jgi:hypothetical protein
MDKWEYCEAHYYGGELKWVNRVGAPTPERKTPAREWLNQQGEQGWELVTVYDTMGAGQYLFLNRPKP